MSSPTNGNGATWTRWVIGVLIFVLLAILTGMGAAVTVNREIAVENRSTVQALKTYLGERLDRIERTLDRIDQQRSMP